MSTFPTATDMTSSLTENHARLTPDGWVMSWLPGRVFTRNDALTAMALVEIYVSNPPVDSPSWLVAQCFERELGLDRGDRP
jgi:hypothetical protein